MGIKNANVDSFQWLFGRKPFELGLLFLGIDDYVGLALDVLDLNETLINVGLVEVGFWEFFMKVMFNGGFYGAVGDGGHEIVWVCVVSLGWKHVIIVNFGFEKTYWCVLA